MKHELSPLRQVESMGVCKYAVFFNFNHQHNHKADLAHLCVCACFCVYISVFCGQISCLKMEYIVSFYNL